jgi:hypothetical protein
LEQEIHALPDYAARVAQVAVIKKQVGDWLVNYLHASAEAKMSLAASLGLNSTEIVPLSESQIDRVTKWLNDNPLHFGHSAFLALKEYLSGQGIQADPNTLAVEAILIDVLVGVINPKTTGDLMLSLFSLQRAAKLHGASATPAQMTFDDLRQMLAAGPAIAHVSGTHYILVTQIAADGTVTYKEPNQGPAGATVTMSQQEFTKVWQGVVLSPRAPPKGYQVLTNQEAQKIRGSLWILIAFVLMVISTGLQFVQNETVQLIGRILGFIAMAINVFQIAIAIGSTVMNGITTALKGFGQGIANGLQTLGTTVFNGITTVAKTLFNPGQLTAALKATAGTAVHATLPQLIASTVFSTGINIGLTKGFEALGLDPAIASIAGAFATGAITGGLGHGPKQNLFGGALSGAITSTAIAGTQLGLTKLGIDPTLASLAGIGVGSIVNSLTVGVQNPNVYDPVTQQPLVLRGLEGLSYTLSTHLAPKLAGELAYYGVQKLGESIGLDSRISQLAGITLSTGIRNITKTGDTTQNVLKGMQDGLTRGALQLGLSFATQGLDPLLGGLASAGVLGAIDGIVSPPFERDPLTGEIIRDPVTGKPKLLDKNSDGIVDQRDHKGIFAGIGESIMRTIGGFTEIGLIKPGDPVATAEGLAKLNDFSNIVREQGLGAALDTYATSLLNRSAIESILNAGSSVRQYGTIRESINAALAPPNPQDTRPRLHVEEVDYQGKRVLQILSADGGYILADKDTHNLIAILDVQGKGQDRTERFIRLNSDVKVDPKTGIAGAPDSTTETRHLSGDEILASIRQEIQGADVKSITLNTADGEVLRVKPNSLNTIRLNDDGTIRDGILVDDRTGEEIRFTNSIPEKGRLRLNAQQLTEPVARTNLDAATQEIANILRAQGEAMLEGADPGLEEETGLEPGLGVFDYLIEFMNPLQGVDTTAPPTGGTLATVGFNIALLFVPLDEFARPVISGASRTAAGKFLIKYADNIAVAFKENAAVFKAKFWGGALGKRIVGEWQDVTRSGVKISFTQYERLLTRSGRPHVFTVDTFHDNLVRLTGRKPVGMDAHHVLPQKFADDFAKAGVNINIHEPWFGAWWESSLNRGEAGKVYNKAWERFFSEPTTNKTRNGILEFTRELAREFKFEVSF